MGFVSLFAFKYSPRPFTPALKLKGEVPEDVKDARLAALLALGESMTAKNLATRVGTTQRVLVCGHGKTGDTLEGRTECSEIVHVSGASDRDAVGHMIDVDVSRAFKHSLAGTITAASRSTLPALSASRATRSLPLLPH